MRRDLEPRGFTIIEAMIALAIVLIAAMGMLGIFHHGLQMNGDAHRMLRATTIAQDLLNNLQTWPYQDNVTGSPMENKSTGNDGDIADTQQKFTISKDPVGDGLADHGEATLAALATPWTGIRAADLGEYQRFWNVRYLDTNADGHNDLVQIAIIVRWPRGDGWRRVVLISGMINPGRE